MIEWRNERRKLRDLVPWEHNPREINRKEAERLGDSLAEFGQIQTIAIGPDNEIYDGHQRKAVWSVLSQFGPDHEVDVRVSSRALTEKERQKLVVYLHRGTMGQWDWDELANGFEVDELLEWGFEEAELQLDWGKDAPDDPGTQMDKAAELQEKWRVQRGQVWQVGRHRVMCGDSTCAEDVARLMGGERADAILTDPPYGQNQPGVPDDEPEKLRGIIEGAVSVLPCTDAAIVAFQSPRTFPVMMSAMAQCGATFERMLWLYKTAQCTFPWRGWLLKSEAIPVWSVGQAPWQDIHPYSHDCYYLPEVSGELKEGQGWHGSVKPLEVVEDIARRICPVGGTLFDGFCGSGTTAVAGERQQMMARVMDSDVGAIAVTLERLTGMGLEAHLVGETGEGVA